MDCVGCMSAVGLIELTVGVSEGRGCAIAVSPSAGLPSLIRALRHPTWCWKLRGGKRSANQARHAHILL